MNFNEIDSQLQRNVNNRNLALHPAVAFPNRITLLMNHWRIHDFN